MSPLFWLLSLLSFNASNSNERIVTEMFESVMSPSQIMIFREGFSIEERSTNFKCRHIRNRAFVHNLEQDRRVNRVSFISKISSTCGNEFTSKHELLTSRTSIFFSNKRTNRTVRCRSRTCFLIDSTELTSRKSIFTFLVNL